MAKFVDFRDAVDLNVLAAAAAPPDERPSVPVSLKIGIYWCLVCFNAIYYNVVKKIDYIKKLKNMMDI